MRCHVILCVVVLAGCDVAAGSTVGDHDSDGGGGADAGNDGGGGGDAAGHADATVELDAGEGDSGDETDGGVPFDAKISVSGKDGCLAYEFASTNEIARYGSITHFRPRVTNTCAEPWEFTGGRYPLKAGVLTHGVAYDRKRPWGLEDGILYLELPAGDCAAVVEYSFEQGETCEYEGQPNFISWDSEHGDHGAHTEPVPPGLYDVYLLSYGKDDGPFGKTLLTEVREE